MLVKREYQMRTVRKLMIAIFFIGYFCFFGSIKAEAAWSNKPKALTSSWKKCGCRSARLVNGTLYVSSGGRIIKKMGSGYGKDTFVNKAYYDNNYIVYFISSNYGYQAVLIYGCKDNNCKFVLYHAAYGIQDLLGFFKGNVYYLTRNDSGTSTRAYRIPIKSYSSGGPYANMGDAVRIPALDQGGGGIQYKNYLYVMGYRGDPSPTFLKVYNLKNGKCKTLSTACTSARIISGKLYYSVTKGYKKNGWGSYKNYKHTVYVCKANGTKKRKLATFVGHYLPPILEKKHAYYYTEGNKLVKRKYGSKKSKAVNKDYAYYLNNLFREGNVVSAG